MKCSVDGCDKNAQYKARAICQMHYFRHMRTGSYELKPKQAKLRRQNPAGYVLVYQPAHPLAHKNGYVYEHRKVVFDKYGTDLPTCELCSKPTDWATCHIDHKDTVVTNNAADNLRPLCRGCNTFRHYPPQHTTKGCYAITFGGETKTANEWSRDSRIKVSNGTIIRRLASGMTVEDALFSEKMTHKS